LVFQFDSDHFVILKKFIVFQNKLRDKLWPSYVIRLIYNLIFNSWVEERNTININSIIE